jgi:UDP-N-acetylmuramoyl-tripeptide--D-alanyl-D-alanine ligase
LSEKGIAVINADDAFAAYWQSLNECRKQVTFGMDKPAMIQAKAVSLDSDGYPTFTLVTPKGEAKIRLQQLGMHNVRNALAAATAAFAAEIALGDIAKGLAAEPPAKMRMVSSLGYQKAHVLDDTYNANPLAMQTALQLLVTKPGKRIMVMGDMGELGPEAPTWHAKMGEVAKNLGVDALYAVGPLSKNAVQQFGAAAYHFTDKPSLIAALRDVLDANTYVLVKGSRSAGMEQVVQGILV